MMNCIWARNTDVETVDPVAGEVVQGRKGPSLQIEGLHCVTVASCACPVCTSKKRAIVALNIIEVGFFKFPKTI